LKYIDIDLINRSKKLITANMAKRAEAKLGFPVVVITGL
jgi:hypothetical protein